MGRVLVTINSKDDQATANDEWGIYDDGTHGGDTYIDEANSGTSYSSAATLQVGDDVPGDELRILLRIKMPDQKDFTSLTDIKYTSLHLKHSGTAGAGAVTPMNLRIHKLQQDYFAVGDATWDEYDSGVGWDAVGGDFDEQVRDVVGVPKGVGGFYEFNLETFELDWGSDINVEITSDGVDYDWEEQFHSRNAASQADQPYLQIKAYDESPEAPTGDDSLTHEPNPDDRTKTLLKWGKSNDIDLRTDTKGCYVVIGDTTAGIVSSGGAIHDRITSPGTTQIIGPTMTEDTTYFFAVFICDDNNYIDNDGAEGSFPSTDHTNTVYGSPTKIGEVAVYRPGISSFAETSGNYTPDVLEEITGVVTVDINAANIPEGITVRRCMISWEGVGTDVEQWVEETTPVTHGNTFEVTHRYSKNITVGSPVTPFARIESNEGYRSDDQNLASTLYTVLISGLGVLEASPFRPTKDVEMTFLCHKSAPRVSNLTITNYNLNEDVLGGGSFAASTDARITNTYTTTGPKFAIMYMIDSGSMIAPGFSAINNYNGADNDVTHTLSKTSGNYATATAATDYLELGLTRPFNMVYIELAVVASADYAGVWEYWDGAAYQTLTLTNDFTSDWTSDGLITFDIPSDWAKSTVLTGYPTCYTIRYRCTAAGTTQPSTTYCVPFALNENELYLTVINDTPVPLSFTDSTRIKTKNQSGGGNILVANENLFQNRGELSWTGGGFERITINGSSKLDTDGEGDMKMIESLSESETLTSLSGFYTDEQSGNYTLIGYLQNYGIRADRESRREWSVDMLVKDKQTTTTTIRADAAIAASTNYNPTTQLSYGTQIKLAVTSATVWGDITIKGLDANGDVIAVTRTFTQNEEYTIHAPFTRIYDDGDGDPEKGIQVGAGWTGASLEVTTVW
jgi:hypothetical protein